jgi:hypothetical protein
MGKNECRYAVVAYSLSFTGPDRMVIVRRCLFFKFLTAITSIQRIDIQWEERMSLCRCCLLSNLAQGQEQRSKIDVQWAESFALCRRWLFSNLHRLGNSV